MFNKLTNKWKKRKRKNKIKKGGNQCNKEFFEKNITESLQVNKNKKAVRYKKKRMGTWLLMMYLTALSTSTPDQSFSMWEMTAAQYTNRMSFSLRPLAGQKLPSSSWRCLRGEERRENKTGKKHASEWREKRGRRGQVKKREAGQRWPKGRQ